MGIDLSTAVNRFILRCAATVLPQERVYRGYQNRTAILAAADGEDYCVYNVSDTRRIGTNVTTYDWARDAIGTQSMREYVYEIDFCSPEEAVARSRAEALETLAGSPIGVDYFKQHGFGLMFADDIKPLPYVLGTDQYVYRYRVPLHISAWTKAEAPQEYFGTAEMRIENVDVHHPIKKE